METVNSFGLYQEQQEVFDLILQTTAVPFNGEALVIGGIGGAGKTYTIKKALEMLSQAGLNGFVGAYTGRASSQLRSAGLPAKTLSKLLYKPVLDDKGDLLYFTKRSIDDVREEAGNFVVIDEGSMVPKEMMDTIMNIGVPVIVSGDYFQLPPVDKMNPNFNAMFSLKGKRAELKTNRRVDPDSVGIFDVTMALRDSNSIPRLGGNGYKTVKKPLINKIQYHEQNQHDVIITGTNKVRRNFNSMVRKVRGFESNLPESGERIVCLQNSVVEGEEINNGEIFEVQYIIQADTISTLSIVNIDSGKHFLVNVYNETWDTEQVPKHHNKERNGNVHNFTYAYSMSCHKVQGSSIENVLFYDEDVSFFLDQQRFRYTACSRASKSLVVAV
jgi:exodeoxyribonuclease-5